MPRRKLFGSLVLFLVAGAFITWQALPAQAAQSNLAAYWNFDESTAGATAADSSGNGNDLTPVNNPVPSTDIPSSMHGDITDSHSASFDGSTQRYTAADNSSLDNTSAVTISTWVKFNTVNDTYQTIVSKWDIGVAQQWTLQLNGDNHIGWWTGDGGTGAEDLESSGTMSSGVWYHLVATDTGTAKQLYINGTLDNSKTDASLTMGIASGVGVGIGGKAAGSVEYLNGNIDDARIYSRVLTSTEVSALSSGNEANTLTGGSAVTNEQGSSSAISDLQIVSTENNPSVSAKLLVSNGTLNMTTTGGLTFKDASGNTLSSPQTGSTLYISGTLNDINAALATLHYTRSSGTGSDTLEASLVQPGEVFFPDNNHLYEYVSVPGGVDWTTAKGLAEARTRYGAQGYLATITSQAENDFVSARLLDAGWMGASDAASEGVWKWVTGPEAGTQFCQGDNPCNSVNGDYTNWNGGEPNNSGNNENCGQFLAGGTGKWNDLPCSGSGSGTLPGYVVEYGAPGNMPTVSAKDIAITTADTTAPSKPGKPSATSPTADTTPTVSWTAASDSGGLATPAYTLQWSASPTFATVTGSATANNTSLAPSTSLTDGTWYFRVVATDASSNSTNSDISSGIVIDSTGPSAPSTPSTMSPTNNTKPTWSWTASSDSGSGLASPAYTVQWSQASNFGSGVSTATTTSASFTQPSNLADGTWYFRVKATDLAGNSSSFSTNGSVFVDTIAPTIPGTPTTTSPTNNNMPTLSWTASSDSGSGLSDSAYTIEWSRDTAFSGLGGIAGASGTSFTVPSNLSLGEGIWYFRVQAVDQVGNTSSFSSADSVVIDTTLPAITNTTASSITDTSATITWTTDKQASSQIAYGPTNSYGSSTTETDISPRVTSHSVTLTGLIVCTLYHFQISSTDALGNLGRSSDATFITTGCAGSANVLAHNDAEITQSSGGDVSLGGKVTLQVPANFAADNADFQIKQIDPDASLKVTGLPSGVNLASNTVYDIKAMKDTTTAITNFNRAVTITMKYTKADTAALIETSLKIYRWDSGTGWSILDNCVVDRSAQTVTCTTPGFSTFALFGTITPAHKPSQTGLNHKPETTGQSQNSGVATIDSSTISKPQTHSSPTQSAPSSSKVPTVHFENDTSKPGQNSSAFLGLGWWWLLIVAIAAAFWWLVVARRRKHTEPSQ